MRYTIQELVDARTGAGVATSVLHTLGEAARASFDMRLLYLRDQPPPMWRSPQAKRLSAEHDPQCKDIYEIRFKARRVEQRPLGYFGPGAGVFTIVLWATHKGSQWKPKDYCRIAREKWLHLQQHGGRTRQIEVD